MNQFLAQCGLDIAADSPLLLSVVIAGLVGSISHCSTMCSPLVAAQMLDLKQNRQPLWRMGFYHAGRIGTYMLLGMMAVFAGQWLFSGALNDVSHLMLALAGSIFVASAIFPRKTHHCCSKRMSRVMQALNRLPWANLQYYLRGALMGFMPCGMLLSVLMLVSTLDSAPSALLVMFAFGLSTVPILQLAGMGALALNRRYPRFGAGLGRTVMAANGIFLYSLGLNLVRVN